MPYAFVELLKEEHDEYMQLNAGAGGGRVLQDNRRRSAMAKVLKRTKAVIRKFDPEQDFWHDARIVVNDHIVLETYWRNPELAGIWLWTLEISPRCFAELIQQDLIDISNEESTADQHVFRLTKKGKARLG